VGIAHNVCTTAWPKTAAGRFRGAVHEWVEGEALTVGFKDLDKTLRHAAEALDKAAAQIRDLEINPNANVHRIGEALTLIFEIQNQLFARQPSLTPGFLKSKKKKRSRRPQES
jgi:hypothetical protein